MNLSEIAPGAFRDPTGYWVTPEAVDTSYPEIGNDFCLTMEEQSFWFGHRNRVIIAAVGKHPPATGPIIDVGAGNAYVSAALESAGFPTVAVEPSRTGAANALRRVSNVVCGAFPSTAFQRRVAGGIALFDVLEHIDKDSEFLQSLLPYLADGGRLYITTPAYSWLWSDHDRLSGHYRRYSLTTLTQALRAAGYRVDYATYFFWCLPLPILFLRALPSKWRRRDDRTFAISRSQHAAGGAGLRRVAEAIFSFETRQIARGGSVPFGGSCLVVASAERADRPIAAAPA